MYTYSLSLLGLPPNPSISLPRSSQSAKLSTLCYIASFPLFVLHMAVHLYQCYSICPTIPFPRCVHMPLLYVCLSSCPVNGLTSTISLSVAI